MMKFIILIVIKKWKRIKQITLLNIKIVQSQVEIRNYYSFFCCQMKRMEYPAKCSQHMRDSLIKKQKELRKIEDEEKGLLTQKFSFII